MRRNRLRGQRPSRDANRYRRGMTPGQASRRGASAAMNLQQLRYVVATADEGTMTQAAAVAARRPAGAQPGRPRAGGRDRRRRVRTRRPRRPRHPSGSRGGGARPPRARRRRPHRERRRVDGAARQRHHRPGSRDRVGRGGPVRGRRAAAGSAWTSSTRPTRSSTSVRDGRAQLGVMELPAPPGLQATSLGWQEIVLLHPPDWTLARPVRR